VQFLHLVFTKLNVRRGVVELIAVKRQSTAYSFVAPLNSREKERQIIYIKGVECYAVCSCHPVNKPAANLFAFYAGCKAARLERCGAFHDSLMAARIKTGT
jgi:hypothetical protein